MVFVLWRRIALAATETIKAFFLPAHTEDNMRRRRRMLQLQLTLYDWNVPLILLAREKWSSQDLGCVPHLRKLISTERFTLTYNLEGADGVKNYYKIHSPVRLTSVNKNGMCDWLILRKLEFRLWMLRNRKGKLNTKDFNAEGNELEFEIILTFKSNLAFIKNITQGRDFLLMDIMIFFITLPLMEAIW